MQKVEKFVKVATIFKRCEVISDNIMLDTLLLEGRDGKEWRQSENVGRYIHFSENPVT